MKDKAIMEVNIAHQDFVLKEGEGLATEDKDLILNNRAMDYLSQGIVGEMEPCAPEHSSPV